MRPGVGVELGQAYLPVDCVWLTGDQVLEWNGVKLTGKTYEEVQQIISQTNGEIELVVRA